MPIPTGVEIGVGRALGSATGKALGWIPRAAMRKIADRRAMNRLESVHIDMTSLNDLVSMLEPTIATRIEELLRSPEIVNIVYQLATKQLLGKVGEKADDHEKRLRAELTRYVELAIGDATDPEPVAAAIFGTFVQSIQEQFRLITPDNEASLAPAARAALVRSATDMAAASARNLELIQQISDLALIDKFERDYLRIVATVHSKMRLPHAGTSRQVSYDKLFVAPSLQQWQSPGRVNDDADNSGGVEPKDLADVSSLVQRLVILGDPGGGKTTVTAKLRYDIAAKKAPQLVPTVPFWITLRDYSPRFRQGLSIIDFIEEQCRVLHSIEPPPNAIEYMLLNGRGVVFFDGLDELLDTSDRQKMVSAVESFGTRYPTADIVVTSRRIGYAEAALDPDMFTIFELGPFSDRQVDSYANNWFGLDDSIAHNRRAAMAKRFLSDSRFVRDLTSNPLMLSLMCGIYAFEGYIPRNRPEVYERCALLLFEKWDKQRGIMAEMSFDAHVQSAIRSVAYWLYTEHGEDPRLSKAKLIAHVKEYLLAKRFDSDIEAEQAATEFIDFCKGRAWVLTELGSDVYGFTHRTFLEYFAASHLVRLRPSANALADILYDRILKAEWDVMSQLAVQILGKNVDDGADDFLDAIVQLSWRGSTNETKENVLSFAARSLEFIVPRPPVLRAIVDALVHFHCSFQPSFEFESGRNSPMHLRTAVAGILLGASHENRVLVSKYFKSAVLSRLSNDPDDQRAAGLGLFVEYYSTLGPSRAVVAADAYWNEQLSELFADLVPYLTLQANKYRWPAAVLVMAGKISVSVAVERFGPAVLYDTSYAGDILIAPIGYRIIHNTVRRAYRNKLPHHQVFEIDESICKEIAQLLPELPQPWFSADEVFDHVVYQPSIVAERFEKATQRKVDLAIQVYLPMAELDLAHRSRLKDREEVQVALKAMRMSSRTKQLLASWARFETNFIAIRNG